MRLVLHANCAHGGMAMPMTTVPNVLVMGQPISVTVPYGIVGCALPPPIAANGPCVTAMWISSSDFAWHAEAKPLAAAPRFERAR